jgi:hypothetical protein
MNTPAKRPVGRTLGFAAVAVLVALVAAVSAFAVGGSTATADNSASSAAQTQPVQDSQATPDPGERGGPGGREDCPEKDGAGGGSQQQGQSSAPDAGSPDPEV